MGEKIPDENFVQNFFPQNFSRLQSPPWYGKIGAAGLPMCRFFFCCIGAFFCTFFWIEGQRTPQDIPYTTGFFFFLGKVPPDRKKNFTRSRVHAMNGARAIHFDVPTQCCYLS